MATSTTQKGILASELKSLSGNELMEKLNTLKGKVKIEGYRSKIPAKKDPANYGSNKNLLNNCQELPIDKALDALEQELKLIMTHNPWVFSICKLNHCVNGYTEDYAELSQSILSSLTKCIETLLKRMTTDEINNENICRICSFIYSINTVIENNPNHITQDCIIIEQTDAGESCNELLGTKDTFECVCLAIKDVGSGKVYFTHIDNLTTKESIEESIKLSFPNNQNLIARLFGGKYRNAVTMDNTKKIIDSLPSHIKIISSDIGNIELDNFNKHDPYLSSTFVVDPKNFEVTNSCPVNLTNNVINCLTLFNDKYVCKLRNNRKYCYPTSCNRKLHMSYINGQHNPSLSTARYMYSHTIADYRDALNCMLSNMEKEKDNYSKLRYCFPYDLLFSLEIGKVIDSLTIKIINTAKSKKKPLERQNMGNIIETIQSINLYIGPNACEANKPIFDFIENHLFKDDCTLDLDGLSKIQMGHDSHCYLQPAKDISNTTSDKSMESPVNESVHTHNM